MKTLLGSVWSLVLSLYSFSLAFRSVILSGAKDLSLHFGVVLCLFFNVVGCITLPPIQEEEPIVSQLDQDQLNQATALWQQVLSFSQGDAATCNDLLKVEDAITELEQYTRDCPDGLSRGTCSAAGELCCATLDVELAEDRLDECRTQLAATQRRAVQPAGVVVVPSDSTGLPIVSTKRPADGIPGLHLKGFGSMMAGQGALQCFSLQGGAPLTATIVQPGFGQDALSRTAVWVQGQGARTCVPVGQDVFVYPLEPDQVVEIWVAVPNPPKTKNGLPVFVSGKPHLKEYRTPSKGGALLSITGTFL